MKIPSFPLRDFDSVVGGKVSEIVILMSASSESNPESWNPTLGNVDLDSISEGRRLRTEKGRWCQGLLGAAAWG